MLYQLHMNRMFIVIPSINPLNLILTLPLCSHKFQLFHIIEYPIIMIK
ncbi:hypothetical protein EMIT079MI2_110078 [Bacillus sp. IT-79MI2]